jgi:hypothetical protein
VASSWADRCAVVSFVCASLACIVPITYFIIANLINVCKVQCTTSETGITWSSSTRDSVGVGRARMGRLLAVLRALTSERESAELEECPHVPW